MSIVAVTALHDRFAKESPAVRALFDALLDLTYWRGAKAVAVRLSAIYLTVRCRYWVLPTSCGTSVGIDVRCPQRHPCGNANV